jgi:serine/threonine protein kinase
MLGALDVVLAGVALDAHDLVVVFEFHVRVKLIAAASKMLAPGTTIGKFEIIERIGAGGMGEVFRATDTSLGRQVALKSLPASFADDPHRLARFEQEARTLAALNHPNIGSIHGIERTDDTSFLELELVEGETLSKTLEAGPLPVKRALEIALEIANALEAAHEKGVVHRDLKPGNIMLTPEGSVKVLDFGLAKIVTGPSRSAAPAEAFATAMTLEGQLLGTPAYMSPEQARGAAVDAQSDIWAFGCVLYELLTGFSTFARPTPAETLGRVFEREPELDLLPPDAPQPIRRLIRRCLAKDKRDRLRHISDARLELREALDPAAAGRDAVMDRAPPPSQSRLPWVVAGVLLVLALTSTAIAWLGSSPTGESTGMEAETFAAGTSFPTPTLVQGNRMVAISPRGSHVAYATNAGLVFQVVGQAAETIQVTGTLIGGPFFSPDGEWIAFTSAAGLMKASIFDGVPIKTADLDSLGAGRVLGGTWVGDTIYLVTQFGVYRVPADANGAAPELVFPAPADRSIAWPEALPGGDALLLTVLPGSSIDNAYTALLDLEAGELGTALVRGLSARYVPGRDGGVGHIVYATSGGKLALRDFDPVTREVGTAPTQVSDVDVLIGGTYLSATFDVSDDGTLVHIEPGEFDELAESWLSWIDQEGHEERIDAVLPTNLGYPRISPDGSRVAFDAGGQTPERRIWQLDLALGIASQVSELGATGPIYEDFQPIWSRDSQRVYFATTRTGDMQVYSSAANGAGPDMPYGVNPDVIVPLAETLDGRLIVMGPDYFSADIGILGRNNEIDWLMQTPTSEVTPSLSPDGNWIAYASNRTGKYEIWVAPFPSGQDRARPISRNGGTDPAWGRDGTGDLYYIGFDDQGDPAMRYVTLDLADGEVERVDEGTVFSREFLRQWTSRRGLRPYDVSPLDGRFLIVRRSTGGVTPLMTVWVTRHWIQSIAP